jgi:hypothetical protein
MMITGTALLAFSACSGHRSAAAPEASALRAASGPVRLAEKHLKDEDGNTVKLRLDETAKAQPFEVTDKAGKPLPIHDYALKDVALCLPDGGAAASVAGAEKAKLDPCQRASSVTEGTFIKFGTASCTCYTVFDRLKCYGTTCP